MSYSARMNPLYAGPPVSCSDSHAAPPQASAPRAPSDEDPKSGPSGYIPPALYQEDEEPQGSYSQHYYVQTPNGKYAAPSRAGDGCFDRPGSPLSSVAQSESRLSAAGHTPLDVRSASSLRQMPKQRSVNVYQGEYSAGYPPAYSAGYPTGYPSGYQAGYATEYAAAVPGRVTGDMAGLEEGPQGDKVPLCKSMEMSAKVALQRKKNVWMMCLVVTMFVLVLAIAGGSIFAYKTFQPDPPSITFEGASMSNLNISYHLQTTPRTPTFQKAFTLVGVSGQPTDLMNLSVTARFAAYNPNRMYSVDCDRAQVTSGYLFLYTLLQTWVPRFSVPAKKTVPFEAAMNVTRYPLYNAGPRLRKDLKAQSMNLTLRTAVTSHVKVLNRMVAATYQHNASCVLMFNPVSYDLMQHTCSFHRVK